jgi:hypothetical protein
MIKGGGRWQSRSWKKSLIQCMRPIAYMTPYLKTVSGYGILDIDFLVAFEVYYLITKIHNVQAEFIRNIEN